MQIVDYIVSLLNHIAKIMLRVPKRSRNKILPEIIREQFGFRKTKGARNAIVVMRTVAERTIEDIHCAFTGYENALFRVTRPNHGKS